ncbi:MAG: hypothetical protein WA948_12925 [Pontixanthobacter sp.]
MNFDDYRSNSLAAVDKPNDSKMREAAFLRAQTWWTTMGRYEFMASFAYETQINISGINRKPEALVTQGFPKTINEYDRKLRDKNYYVANALMAIEQLDRLFATKPASGDHWTVYYGLFELAWNLVFDTITLFEHYAMYCAGVPNFTGTGKNPVEHIIALYHSANQVVHGYTPGLSFLDHHGDTSIAPFRMAIEMRFRYGFGAIGRLDKKGSQHPLSLSAILAGVKQYKNEITFGVPLPTIERLYGWANIYVHSGLKQYAWSPMHALRYTRPFLLGVELQKGFDANSGIRAKVGTISKVQKVIEDGIDKKRFDLVAIDPAHCAFRKL